MAAINATLDEYYQGGPKDWNEVFKATCIKSHWDPTMVVEHVLPKFQHDMALDPRQSVRNCYVYYNTSPGDAQVKDYPVMEPQQAPHYLLGGPHRPNTYEKPQIVALQNVPVFPPGGAASLGFPYDKFNANAETDVLRIDEPLTKCAEKRYIPPGGIPAPSIQNRDVPGVYLGDSSTLSPLLTRVSKQAGCRNQDDEQAWNRSARLFFNPTKYDRTITVPPNLYQPSSHNALVCPPWKKS
jgi:hypothetical protein